MCPVEASRALVPVLDGGSFNVVNFVTLGAVLAFLKSQAASVAEVCSSAVLPLVMKEISQLVRRKSNLILCSDSKIQRGGNDMIEYHLISLKHHQNNKHYHCLNATKSLSHVPKC